MTARRIVSTLLTLAMLMTLLGAFGAVSVGAAVTISNTSPCITAEVGDTVDLSDYAVTFDNGTVSSSLSWKEGGSSVSSVTCTAAGMRKLTATSGSNTKSIYLVTKEKDDTEYVLFDVDLTKYSNLTQLTAEGWKFLDTASYYSLSSVNGLVIGNLNDDYVRVILPEWLGDFGDFDMEAEMKMLTSRDTGRWTGLVYRIQNQNGNYYPYYHMCIRENTTVSTGVEFAERTSGNIWNVIHTAGATITSLKSNWNTAKVCAFGKTVQYLLDGSEVLYVNDATAYKKGQFGLTVNFGTVAYRRIRITVRETAPTRPERKLDLINNTQYDMGLTNAVANVQIVPQDAVSDFLGGTEFPGIALLEGSSSSSFYVNAINVLAKNNCIPGFAIKTQAQADAVVSAMNSTGIKDVFIASDDSEILVYARNKKNILRAVLVLEELPTALTSKEADEIRRAVRSAGATSVIVGGDYFTKQAVKELQELAVAVWAVCTTETQTVSAVSAGVNGIVTEDAKASAALINGLFEDFSMTRTPIIVGHRGNPNQAPENSLLGFITAYNNGADVVEIDIYLSKDKEVVIMHDTTIDRTTNGSGTVTNMTVEQLKQYNLKYINGRISEEKIPTLRELLDVFKDINDCRIFVEVKGSDVNTVIEACKVIEEYDMEDRVDFISFSNIFLAQAQRCIQGMSTGYLLSPSGTATTPEDALAVFYNQLVSAQSCNSTVNISYGPATEYYMQAATDRGQTVWPWTYVASNNNVGFLACVDGLTTNDAQWAKNMLKFISTKDSIILPADGTTEIKAHGTTYGGEKKAIESTDLIVKIVDGSDVVSVSGGTVTALKQGEAALLVGYKTQTTAGSPYVLYTDLVTVTVGDADGIVFAGGSKYDESNGLITDVLPDTDVTEFLDNVKNADAKIFDAKGKELGFDDKVTTGSTVEAGGKKYTIIVKGDINGDGALATSDYVMCKRAVLGTYDLTELQKLAADVDGKNQVATADYVMIKRAVLGTYVISDS